MAKADIWLLDEGDVWLEAHVDDRLGWRGQDVPLGQTEVVLPGHVLLEAAVRAAVPATDLADIAAESFQVLALHMADDRGPVLGHVGTLKALPGVVRLGHPDLDLLLPVLLWVGVELRGVETVFGKVVDRDGRLHLHLGLDRHFGGATQFGLH